MKKLERGRFNWPDTAGAATMDLTVRELEILIGSARLRSKLKRQEILRPSVA